MGAAGRCAGRMCVTEGREDERLLEGAESLSRPDPERDTEKLGRAAESRVYWFVL